MSRLFPYMNIHLWSLKDLYGGIYRNITLAIFFRRKECFYQETKDHHHGTAQGIIPQEAHGEQTRSSLGI